MTWDVTPVAPKLCGADRFGGIDKDLGLITNRYMCPDVVDFRI